MPLKGGDKSNLVTPMVRYPKRMPKAVKMI